MKKTALIVGVSGIVGRNLADLLIAEQDWIVYGVARRLDSARGIIPIAVDLQDAAPSRLR
jgi:GDP-D-mannose dehydratase